MNKVDLNLVVVIDRTTNKWIEWCHYLWNLIKPASEENYSCRNTMNIKIMTRISVDESRARGPSFPIQSSLALINGR